MRRKVRRAVGKWSAEGSCCRHKNRKRQGQVHQGPSKWILQKSILSVVKVERMDGGVMNGQHSFLDLPCFINRALGLAHIQGQVLGAIVNRQRHLAALNPFVAGGIVGDVPCAAFRMSIQHPPGPWLRSIEEHVVERTDPVEIEFHFAVRAGDLLMEMKTSRGRSGSWAIYCTSAANSSSVMASSRSCSWMRKSLASSAISSAKFVGNSSRR